MSTAGGRAGIRVVIDERRPSSDAAVVDDAADRANGRRRTTEPPTARTATDAPPRLADRPLRDAPPRLAERRPARDSVAAPYSFDDFPLRVVRAMHEAARAYRARVAEEIDLRRVAILTAIRDQRRADVLRARAEAAENRRAADMWALTAQRQIKRERQRRKVGIEAELRRTLEEQNQAVDRRVRAVEAAIAAHREQVDAFFDEIDRERDPVAIAERARRRPAFPTIDTTASVAMTDATPAPAYVQTEIFDLDG